MEQGYSACILLCTLLIDSPSSPLLIRSLFRGYNGWRSNPTAEKGCTHHSCRCAGRRERDTNGEVDEEVPTACIDQLRGFVTGEHPQKDRDRYDKPPYIFIACLYPFPPMLNARRTQSPVSSAYRATGS